MVKFLISTGREGVTCIGSLVNAIITSPCVSGLWDKYLLAAGKPTYRRLGKKLSTREMAHGEKKMSVKMTISSGLYLGLCRSSLSQESVTAGCGANDLWL